MHLGIAVDVPKAIVLYRCKKVSKLVTFSFAIIKIAEAWWGRKRNNRGAEKQTIFRSGSSFHSCSSHTQYMPSISSAVQRLQGIVEQETVKNIYKTDFNPETDRSFCISSVVKQISGGTGKPYSNEL